MNREVQRTFVLLRQLGSGRVCFQWNECGHFCDYAARYERALRWAWGD